MESVAIDVDGKRRRVVSVLVGVAGDRQPNLLQVSQVGTATRGHSCLVHNTADKVA